MFGKSSLKSCGKWHIVLAIWLIFATIYVIYGEYNRLNNYVAAQAYNSGVRAAVNRIIDESANCQPLPINIDDKKATLISVDCLQKSEAVSE